LGVCSCENGACTNDIYGTGLCSQCFPKFYGPNCNFTCDCGNETDTDCIDDINGNGTCVNRSAIYVGGYTYQVANIPAVIGGSTAGSLLFLIFVVCFIIIWRRRNAALDISVLPEYLQWFFDEKRIELESWTNEFHEDVKVKDVTNDKKYTTRVQELLNLLDGSKVEYTKVMAVYNRNLLSNFLGYRRVIQVRHHSSPGIFKKENWNTIDERKELRKWVKERYDALVAKFTWNDPKDPVPVLASCHGTDGKIAQQICSTGFAALSSLDAGFYGKGIYFSSSCLYTTPYFVTKKNPCIIICLIIPGNTRPIVETKNEKISYLGVTIDSGYQSHYVITNREGIPLSKIRKNYYDEIVLAIDPQVIPLFLLSLSMKTVMTLSKEFNREIPGERAQDQIRTKSIEEDIRQDEVSSSSKEEDIRTVAVHENSSKEEEHNFKIHREAELVDE